MGVRRYRDLIAWQLADGFKSEVFGLVRLSPKAQGDRPYRDQLISASSAVSKDIAEGFLRDSAGDFGRFLGFALGSLAEAEGRVADGVELRYFREEDCQEAFRFARRAAVAMTRLKISQHHYVWTAREERSRAEPRLSRRQDKT